MPNPTATPFVTIAMPFFNSEGTIALAIQSLLSQTYSNFELLLCDDGSTDRSLEIARSFNDPRIVISSDGQRKNLAMRLNECIDQARGQYLGRMDADDIAFPERLDIQIRFLQQHPETDLVSTNAVVFGKEGGALGKKSGPTRHADLVRFPMNGFRMWHPTWVGKLSWFRKYRYCERAALAQDQELLFRAYKDSVYANLEPVLLGYRQEHLRLKKMVRYRFLWFRYLGWHLKGPRGLLSRLILAPLLLVKVTGDCVAVGTGLKYKLLRRRARPLSQPERQQWAQVWADVNSMVQQRTQISSALKGEATGGGSPC